MKLQRLIGFLLGEIKPEVFANEIDDEVKDYKQCLKVKGASAPVYLSNGASHQVSKTNVLTICEAFLDGILSQWHVCYISDALLMSENITFADDLIRDMIESLTDPETNGEIDKNRITEIRRELKNKRA